VSAKSSARRLAVAPKPEDLTSSTEISRWHQGISRAAHLASASGRNLLWGSSKVLPLPTSDA
jgi:hypothetical protein